MLRLCIACAMGLFALFASLVLMAASAQAAKFHFGPDESLHVIAETKLLDGSKPLSLCYKTYTYFVVAGVYTTDAYALCEGGSSKRYMPLPDGDELAALQQQGLLPSPLPAYKRPILDYVQGFSLWLLIVVGAGWTYFETRRSKAAAPKKLALLKTTTRRVMARVVSTAAVPDRGAAMAHQIYKRLFGEALADADFAIDMAWVQNEPAAFDGFVGAMGRKFDQKARAVVLRAAAHVAMADGTLEDAEAASLRHLAGKLGFKPKEADALLVGLRQQSAGPGVQAA